MSQGVDSTSDRAAYRQIADQLRDFIRSGQLPGGEQLPSERTLMDRYRAARGTIRQALALLKAEGLIRVEHGRGAFVRERPPIRRLAFDRFARRHREEGKAAFIAEVEAEGSRPGVEVLRLAQDPANDEIAARLGLDEGAPVFVRQRRYLRDEEPVEMATSYLPLDLVEGTKIVEEDTGPGGIYARLEEAGHSLARFTEEVSARMPMPEEVRELRLAAGVPVFALVRVAYDTEGRAVEVCDTVMAGDRYVLTYELPAR